MKKKQWKFKWISKLVDINLIKKTPKNYKIKNELGAERLKVLLADFGLAGNVVVNTDYTLIDGNSRLQEAKDNGEKKIWVSLPNKKLSPKEFKVFSSMFDAAKAGDVDMDSIIGDLGNTQDFLKKFNLQVPVHLLESMGKNARVDADIKFDEKGTKPASQFSMVTLAYTAKQEKLFREMEDILLKKFKTEDTSTTVLMAMKALTGKK